MMTPSELREYEFKGAGRNAYKSDDVDTFFGEVAVAYEKIFRENAELIKRIGLLADRLEQYKHDEEQIKQAVIGAQKAADIIIKEAEMSVEDSKSEAEAILAAAKGEADIIKADAEKQAIADSDLLLSIARDKAEQIINKAKEEAHGILIKANDSAKDTVGAATRTITSESLHYEMLKKEVSEFRTSILAQYKAHIEMISKLPELAAEESAKQEESVEDTAAEETLVNEINSVDPENDIIEFVEEAEEVMDFNEEFDDEEVVKTTLPYDFFEENSTLEFVEEDNINNNEENVVINEASNFGEKDETVSFECEADDLIEASESAEFDSTNESVITENEESVSTEDVPISRGFSVNTSSLSGFDNASVDSDKTQKSLFTSFETIEDDDDDEQEIAKEIKQKRGFFRRKK